jgi:predicted ATPase
MAAINPNSDRANIDSCNLTDAKVFPLFITSVKFEPFRHIDNLEFEIKHPISVITGTNRSGKSTILMALACSHFDFLKRNMKNGNLERHTWSSLMKFTNHDKQSRDWTYFIGYKTGARNDNKRGQRKHSTGKWNGIGKKESQIKQRQVVFIDLDRVMPARNFNSKIFFLAKNSISSAISTSKITDIEQYISYILEEKFTLNKLAKHLDKDIFKYKNQNEYSSFNAATGEEVLIKIIIDAVEANKNALILIDEVEIGLHPKVQRRLLDVLYNIARTEQKQFILTSHSSTILSSLPEKARIFIERQTNGTYKAITEISVNAAMTKMDSISYPLYDLFCEDYIAEKIILKAISYLQKVKGVHDFGNLVNIIISNSADQTYSNFQAHKRTYNSKKIKIGYACVLDGDMAIQKTKNNILSYPPEANLHFLPSDKSPEYFLVKAYVSIHPNSNLDYHLNNSDNHCLFQKMVECTNATDKNDAFEMCWSEFVQTPQGTLHFNELIDFLYNTAKVFSPDL